MTTTKPAEVYMRDRAQELISAIAPNNNSLWMVSITGGEFNHCDPSIDIEGVSIYAIENDLKGCVVTFEDTKNSLEELEAKLAQRFNFPIATARASLIDLDQRGELLEDEIVADWHGEYASYLNWMKLTKARREQPLHPLTGYGSFQVTKSVRVPGRMYYPDGSGQPDSDELVDVGEPHKSLDTAIVEACKLLVEERLYDFLQAEGEVEAEEAYRAFEEAERERDLDDDVAR